MPTAAIAAYGIQLRIGDGVPLTTLTVTGATNTTPVTVTTSTSHGITDVTVVSISGVLGNTGANGTFLAARVNATQLTLRGSVGTGAYTSGGGLVITETFATIAEMTNLQDAGIMATLVETSSHDGNGWVSRVPVILGANAIRLNINLVPTNSTHNNTTGLAFLLRTKARRSWLLVFPDALRTSWWFTGWVMSHRTATPVAGILASEVVVEMTDVPLLSSAA